MTTSESQYFAFQSIDRPLTRADQAALRALSSRAQITATGFTNAYDWERFRGDLRLFYPLWLSAIGTGSIVSEALEPMPGMGPMAEALTAFAAFSGLDRDRAAAMLQDLMALSREKGAQDEFARRLRQMRERHARKARLIERLAPLGS